MDTIPLHFMLPQRCVGAVKTLRHLGIGIAGAYGPSPILRPPRHGQVMPGHEAIDVENDVPLVAHASAHLRLFSSDQTFVVAADLLQHGMTDQCISATKLRWYWRIDPVEIEDTVVY